MTRLLVILSLLTCLLRATPKHVAVFVALCDNASQGIAPVPAKIGNGNNPGENLYWGNSEGLKSWFSHSKSWKLVSHDTPTDPRILERLVFRSSDNSIELTAEGWRGSEIKNCLTAFESALISGKHDLCAYIGHDVLMDANIPPPTTKAAKPCDAIVLCCMSQPYFESRLTSIGAHPVLLTSQLMYPGAFLLHDALPSWSAGKPLPSIRLAAAISYAHNQKITTKAALGVFADLTHPAPH